MHGQHTLSVLVENRPGVLTRIAGMFARRNYNIHSLAVGPTDDVRVSRLTVVVGTEAVQLEQIIKQLNKLVHVLKIVELDPDRAVERELGLVKVRAEAAVRYQIVELAEMFRAKIVDVAPAAPVAADHHLFARLEEHTSPPA
jgi:acetolactate synthase-1/3 small subunit